MGVLPNSQYGSVAALPITTLSSFPNTSVVAPSSQGTLVNTTGTSVALSSTGPGNSAQLRLNADLSALSIRATEYLQRWKEVVQFSSKDYSDQMAAQFGVKAPEYMGNHAHYIGGWSSVININEVVNTNLDTDSSQAVS